MVMVLSLASIVTGNPLLLMLLAYGFLARVTTGPTLSIMGLLATRVIVPLMGNPSRPVPGPPKRFAQAIGLAFSGSAMILLLVMESNLAARAILVPVTVFAALEAFVGFCAGCFVFNHLMRLGIIPESVCQQCVLGPDLGD